MEKHDRNKKRQQDAHQKRKSRPATGKLKNSTSGAYSDSEDSESDVQSEQHSREARQTENSGYGCNFDFNASHPVAVSGHFKFKSEQEWNDEMATMTKNTVDFFRINLSLLEVGLSAIPFYERQNIPASDFSSLEIQLMDQMSEINRGRYTKVLSKTAKPEKGRQS